MPEPPTTRVLNRLHRVKNKGGGGWMASCPAPGHQHNDQNRSLSIDERDGKLLLKCFIGHTTEDILAAIQLTAADLFTDGTLPAPLPFQAPRRNMPPVAVYEYRNHTGEVIAEKGRFELPDGRKSFLWRAKGDTGWSGLDLAGLSLTDLALWGAESVVTTSADVTVYFVEGEKARLACIEHGLIAITHAGGASTKDFGQSLEVLAGRKVALWPDNDAAGREYMALVESRLRGRVASLTTISVPLPPKGDAWEYFDAGGTVADLERGSIPLTGPVIDLLADDALRVSLPSPIGIIAFTFSEIEKSRRAFDTELAIEVTAPGYPADAYTERINILSGSAGERLRRDLDSVYGKEIGWTRLLNTAFAAGRKAYLSQERSTDLYDLEDRGQDLFFIAPLLPADQMTIWFGDGSSLKSYLAFTLAFCVAHGMDFVGHTTRPGPVLIVDYEDQAHNFRRRMNRIALGLGFHGFSPGLIRYFPGRGIPLPDLVDSLARIIQDHGISLMIVDSLGPACGGEPEKAEVALAYTRAVSRLQVTTLHLAHITKDDARRGRTNMPFGSVYWHNEARRTWYVAREQEEDSDDLDIGLFCRKVNDGPRPKPIAVRVHFEGLHGAVTLDTQPISAVASLQKRRPAKDQITEFLRTAQGGTATIKELAAALALNEDTVEKTLGRTGIFTKVGTVKSGGRAAILWGRRFPQEVEPTFSDI